MKNRWLFAAGLASLVLVVMHLVGGGEEVYAPLLRTTASGSLSGYVTFLWHAMTAILLIDGVVLLLAAFRPDARALAWPVIARLSALALLVLAIAVTVPGSLLAMPQWIFFLSIVALALPGVRHRGDRSR